MEAVAARAGVGKATIYRRWRSKTELVAEVLKGLRQAEPPPDTGSFRSDVLELATRQLGLVRAQPGFGRLAPRLLGDSADDPALHAMALDSMVTPMRAILGDLIARALERGDLRPDIDPEVVTDIIQGSIFYKVLILGQDLSELDERYIGRVLDELLPGIERPEVKPAPACEKRCVRPDVRLKVSEPPPHGYDASEGRGAMTTIELSGGPGAVSEARHAIERFAG